MIAQQPINLKTSKNWVLPPRPKPGRKHKANAKSSTTNSPSLTDLLPDYNNVTSLSNNLKLIDQENLELKSHLLSLIKEYKSLKSQVFDQQQQQESQPTSPFSIETSPSINSTSSISTSNMTSSTSLTNTTPITHKRSYYEIEMEEYLDFNHYSEDDDNDDDNDEEIFSELSRSTTTSTTSDLLYNSK
ncbi:hypothetical protein Cantr_05804 [Candida viswanathii]|uniref:Hap4 transcription factor heteromerisation domain-containing protein n=1 Tax=Candida viswanathii TaxID=5486 RepID=A0A367XQX3_9ASCO|nr:hypothetical protein Cantr_05804 [Candida viswanathii]